MRFKALIYLKTKDEGGRHTPIFRGYAPKFSVSGRLYSCEVVLPSGTEIVMPGSKLEVEIEIEGVALNSGTSFELVEESHVTASGTII
jgi:elongation factor Tu